jgi:post-segregation antitoxin (ccd killing protein)
MARANVYLPDELAREWRRTGRMGLSQLTQIAMRRELARSQTDQWLLRVTVQRSWDVSHEMTTGALGADAAAGDDPS